MRRDGAVGPQAMGEIAAAHRWRSHNMADLSALELEVAQTIIEALNLEDTRAEDIDPEEALFRDGLGLDSIDALEIALAISMKYGFQIRSDDNDNARIFASLRTLSQHVGENRVK
jgi:acyl carrier protein